MLQGFPQYKCNPDCECNDLTREKLREHESTEGTPREHMRENLTCKYPWGFLANPVR